MPVWQETHGPSGNAAAFHANHCCSRPSRYRAARSGLHPSPMETIELSAKARPVRKKRHRYMATASASGKPVVQDAMSGGKFAEMRVGGRSADVPPIHPSKPGYER